MKRNILRILAFIILLMFLCILAINLNTYLKIQYKFFIHDWNGALKLIEDTLSDKDKEDALNDQLLILKVFLLKAKMDTAELVMEMSSDDSVNQSIGSRIHQDYSKIYSSSYQDLNISIDKLKDISQDAIEVKSFFRLTPITHYYFSSHKFDSQNVKRFYTQLVAINFYEYFRDYGDVKYEFLYSKYVVLTFDKNSSVYCLKK